MQRTGKILRRSVHIFLQDYHHFTSTCALLVLPFAVSVLLSQSFIFSSPPSLLPTIYYRLRTLFDAAGFPASSEFFNILNLKISQTISSSFIALPFSLTFLLFGKSCVVASVNHDSAKPVLPVSFSSFIVTYKSILATYICNSLIILSANATALSLLFVAFNCLEAVYASNNNAPHDFTMLLSAVLYSIILAHALVVCNLALVLSGSEKIGGSVAILKACVMISGSTSTALSLAVPVNLALAATEALFHFRVVRYHQMRSLQRFPVAMESLLIAFLYSMLIVLDTIAGCIFYRSCKEMNPPTIDCNEDGHHCQIEIGNDRKCSRHHKTEIPKKLQLECR
ncbi:hypothetical protein MLD38_026178 [Melastoma candidum]|nr:hypothetical protein MLD38_026178 [Melastoma candidum]